MNLKSYYESLENTLVKFGKVDITWAGLLAALSVLIITWFALKVMRRGFKRSINKKKLTRGQGYAYAKLISYIAYVIAFLFILENLGIKFTWLIGASAALLVGIGVGLQQLFNDLASGFIILMENTIGVGDIIEVDDVVSRVISIGIRTSKVETREGIHIIVPNSKIVSDQVINWSTQSAMTRFKVNVGVAYGSNVQLVKKILLHCAEQHGKIVQNPSPFCRFVDFGESSLNFELLFWSKELFGIEDVKSDLRFMIDSEFRKQKVTIPFPQRDLHIKSSQIGNLNSEKG